MEAFSLFFMTFIKGHSLEGDFVCVKTLVFLD